MTRWLQAATAGLCQTDRTDKTPAGQAISAQKTPAAEVLSVLSVCQFDGEQGSAQVPAAPWSGRSYPPEAIRAGVTDAFTDWQAMNNPHDPRAWA